MGRHLFCMNKLYFCQKHFSYRLTSCFKNTIDLLLFYEEHFYGLLEGDLWKHQEKNIHFTGHKHFEVLWSFILYII